MSTLSASATVDLTYDIYVLNASAGSVTITLPDLGKEAGRRNTWRRSDNSLNTVTLAAHSGQSIDGRSSVTLSPLAGLNTFVADTPAMFSMGGSGVLDCTTALEVSAKADTTTTSTTDTLLDGMSATPTVSSRYFITGSTSVRNSAALAIVTLSIYVNGTLVDASERPTICTTQTTLTVLTTQQLDQAVATQAMASVGAGQAVELRWRTSAGTATAHQRTLSLLRIGT